MCAALLKLRTAVQKVITEKDKHLPDEPKKGDFWNQLAKGFKKVEADDKAEKGPIEEVFTEDEKDPALLKKEARQKVRKLLNHLDVVYNKPKPITDSSDGLRIEDYLQLSHLENLKYSFENFHPPRERIRDELRPNIKKYRQPGSLNIKEFKNVLYAVLGERGDLDEQLEKLFLKLDTGCHGYVDWGEFSAYLMTYFKELDRVNNKSEVPFRSDPKIRHVVFNHQEPTARILLTEHPIRPISVTKTGTILLWDCMLKLEAYLQTQDAPPDLSFSPQQRRRFHEWVMDSVYMGNCRKLALTTSGREIKFFDVASNVIKEEFVLFGLKYVPLVIKYYPLREAGGPEGILFCGDDGGNVYKLHFKKPVSQLFDMPSDPNHKAVRVWVVDIASHERCVEYEMYENVHTEAVNNLHYISENNSLVSCCCSPNNSVIVYDLSRRKAQYVFKIRRGAECFDICRSLNILVTGSPDHYVRLWNPYVPSKAISLLEGHNNPVLAVQIHATFGVVLSYSRDGAIKVWDVKAYVCLQTVNLRLPFMTAEKMPDHMNNPMLLNVASNSVYITASDYIIQYRLGKPVDPVPGLVLTHKEQLCGALYNPLFSQVTTGSDDSSVITWEVETGNKCLVLANAHEGEEITCLSYDSTCRRLLTGSRNGKIKVWNFQNGVIMHLLEPCGESEVTGVTTIPSLKKIFAVGWNKRIVTYKDVSPEDMHLSADISWKGGIGHSDDILTSDFCPPELFATASYDGAILVWNIDHEKLVIKLREGFQQKIEKVVCHAQGITPPPSRGSMPSRPNSRHRSHYRAPARLPAPVDKLIFFKKRASDKRYRESAFLVTSEAGYIRFWSVHGNNHQLAAFYGAVEDEECVLGLCTNYDNSILVAGDTSGYVTAWNITNYCLFQTPQCISKAPVEVVKFRANEAALVSVDLAEIDNGPFVITASVDCTAKLFTFNGEIIGVFGQPKPWDIHNRKTWKQTQIDRQHLFESLEDKEPVDDKVNGTVSTSPFVTQPSRETTLLEDDVLSDADLAKRAHSNLSVLSKPADIPIHSCQLGIKVEKDFERMRLSRLERRNEFGEVETSKVVPQGTICSPYSALKTAEFTHLKMPDNLPPPPTWSLQKSKTTVGKNAHRLAKSLPADPVTDNLKLKAEKSNVNGFSRSSPRRLPPIANSD